MNLKERFEQFSDEYLNFARVEVKRSNRPDLHAFLVLDEIQPGDRDLISCSCHDEFFLNIDCDAFAASVTDAQLKELTRCGIRYDDDTDSLCMFA